MSELFIILGVLALSFGLRSFRHPVLRKIGAVGILAATFLAFYFPTESLLAGCGGLLMWFLLPWVELLTRIRQLRLPVHKTLEKTTPPNASRFPDLSNLTDEVENEGFEYVSDNGWEWDGMSQFYRIFYHEEKRQEAAICFTEQDGIAWGCLTLTSRRPDGLIYRTTNLPFSNPMKSAPDLILRQSPESDTFPDLLELHEQWLHDLALETSDFVAEDPETLTTLIEQETGEQIQYNLETGLIRLAEKAGTFRYSWRGLFYLYFQLVKDMVKLC